MAAPPSSQAKVQAQGQGQFQVRRHPINRPESQKLIAQLNADLDAMYASSPTPLQPESSTQSLGNGNKDNNDINNALRFFVAFKKAPLPTSSDPTRTDKNGFKEDEREEKEEAIGCIALRALAPSTPGTDPRKRYAELKRMYVSPAQRGRGLSTLLLHAAIEVDARHNLDDDAVVLETGNRQVAAIKVYERYGFVRRKEMYGEWIGAGVEDGGISLCFEKDLRTTRKKRVNK